jgi:8-oxo-dGTP pyrophosphatase MutT (NUDIX family)
VGYRIRVAGLLVHDGQILLVQHRNQNFWLLPGGRLDEGESLHECVEREILEETGIKIRPQGPVFLGDFLSGRKHIVDVIFRVDLQTAGKALPRIRIGDDAGLADARWFPLDAAPELGPPPLDQLLKQTHFSPENLWGQFHYGGAY